MGGFFLFTFSFLTNLVWYMRCVLKVEFYSLYGWILVIALRRRRRMCSAGDLLALRLIKSS